MKLLEGFFGYLYLCLDRANVLLRYKYILLYNCSINR